MTMPPAATQRRRGSLPALFFGLGLAIMIVFVLWIAQGVIVPVVIAAFVSFLIVTVKRGIRRVPLIGPRLPEVVSFTLAFAVIVLVMFGLVAIVRENVAEVLQQAPLYRQRFAEIVSATGSWAADTPLARYLPSAVDSLRQQADSAVTQALGGIAGFTRGIAGGLVTILLYVAFMLVERGRLLRKVSIVAGPERSADIVEEVIDDIAHLIREYVSIKTLTSAIVSVVAYAIMAVLGVDFALFWALLIFAFNFIPIIGSIVAVILPTVLALVQPGGGIGLMFLTGGLLTAAEQAVGSVVEPRLMGKSLNLSPLVILLSLAVWGTLWGFAGLLLCVPMTVALMIILSQFAATRPIAVLLSEAGEIAPLKRGHTDAEERRPTPRGAAAV